MERIAISTIHTSRNQINEIIPQDLSDRRGRFHWICSGQASGSGSRLRRIGNWQNDLRGQPPKPCTSRGIGADGIG